MNFLGVLVIAMLLSSGPARAEQCGRNGVELKRHAICSKTFEFGGICDQRKYKYEGWDDVVIAVGAWEDAPIRIIAASAEAMVQAPSPTMAVTARIYAGNSFNADLMTPERRTYGQAAAVVYTDKDFPSDLGVQFPAGEPWNQTHLDVHLACFPKGSNYSGSLTVWYKIDRDAAQ